MRLSFALAITALVVACKNNDSPLTQAATPSAPAADAAAPASADWMACESALRAAPRLPATRRAQALVEACKPCGDWQPLLDWQREKVDGGPSRPDIEQAMLACNAYCSPDAKQRFLSTLDNARGKQNTRGPWRHLGEICRADVSAVPDARYVSAPYFALDRIARAVAARPALAPLLDAIDLPLPPVSASGAGFELPKAPVTAPDLPPIALTVTAAEVRIASTPRAKLGKAGVVLVARGEPYPGIVVKTPKDVDAALATLGEGDVAVFAPYAMPARHVAAALALTRRDARLAVLARTTLVGWTVAGTIPIALATTADAEALRLELHADADHAMQAALADRTKLAGGTPVAIVVAPDATVEGLAKLLGAIAYADVKRVAVVER